jgi:hypothetical protein
MNQGGRAPRSAPGGGRRSIAHDEGVTDVGIDELLASFGLEGDAAALGRRALEEAGLTNPRKQRIAAGKSERAREAVDARLARLCAACAERAPRDGRRVVVVPPSVCARCGGSNNRRALRDLVDACVAGGVRRLVVVGGSPALRTELRTSLGGELELRLVDGVERRTKTEAQGDLAWADVVLVWGSSILAHKVSTLYTRDGGSTPVVVVPRRSIEALAGEVVRHLGSRTS